jgi:hypothetical protein
MYDGQAVPPVIRILPTGQRDTGFNLVGAQTSTIVVIAPAPNDRLYVGERTANTLHVWRVLPNGSIDSTFIEGIATMDPLDINVQSPLLLFALQPVPDGVMVGGSFSHYNGSSGSFGLVKVLENGSVDLSFRNSSEGVSNILPTAGGKFYVVNYGRTDINSWASYLLHRLNPDGSHDDAVARFNFFGKFAVGRNFGPRVECLVPILDSADFYACGTFTVGQTGPENPLFDPTGQRGVARFNGGVGTLSSAESRPIVTNSVTAMVQLPADRSWVLAQNETIQKHLITGEQDPTFRRGVTNGTVATIVHTIDGTNDMIVGGSFTTYNDAPVGHLVRITANGTLR